VADKPRTPPPPGRPVQAPQRRDTRSGGPSVDPALRRKLLRYGIPAVVALVVVIVAIVAFAGGGSSTSLAAAFDKAGCTLTSYKGQPAQHTANLAEKITYNSFPPSSGKHYQQPVAWGSYPTPVITIQAVHNLEHGGIWILWGDRVPQAQRDALQSFYDDDSNAMLVSPFADDDLKAHPSFRNKISLVAWNAPEGKAGNGRVLTCPRFDKAAFAAFKDAYRGKGPERFSVSDLRRGSS
jgi:hypothetical protein